MRRRSETNELFIGIASDSCWLFRLYSGKVNLYGLIPARVDDLLVAAQVGEDGLFMPLTKENLMPIIGQERDIIELLEKGKLVKAVKKFNKN